MKHTLPQLPYEYDALVPHIDALTMNIHHTKHHQTYVNNLNVALEKHPELFGHELLDLLMNLDNLPSDVVTAIRNNGGGHFNHSLFWTLLTPRSTKQPLPKVAKAVDRDFGSFDAFKEAFSNVAKTRFGSGWAWLIVTPPGKLKVLSTPNQDTPIKEGHPILALDVWEHAYYLNFQNRRPDYIEAFWNIVNWQRVEQLYEETL